MTLELLFLAMNAEHIDAKIRDPDTRWLMLQGEVQLRVQDNGSASQHRLRVLIRRMRAYLRKSAGSAPPYTRTMLHIAIASVRIRVQRDSQAVIKTGRHRIFASLHSALRAALVWGDVGFLTFILGFYDELYALITRPDEREMDQNHRRE